MLRRTEGPIVAHAPRLSLPECGLYCQILAVFVIESLEVKFDSHF